MSNLGQIASTDLDLPRVHVVPPRGRLNDPNGLIVDGDTFHIFYQWTPDFFTQTTGRKRVHWGHAISSDLLHFTHLDAAIDPDSRYDRHGAYSGGALKTDDGVAFFYTGNVKDEVTDEREASQNLVWSHDLETFTKDARNPVIPAPAPGYTNHYRDPQVWREADGSYRMLLGAQREDLTGACVLYRSDDLLTWTFWGELSFPDAAGTLDPAGYMWECPNLVRLRDEATGQVRDVLIICPQDHTLGDRCVALVGRLDGLDFRECDGAMQPLDEGYEFYAPQAFARTRDQDGPALLLGWAGNPAQDAQPSAERGWVHCLTLPRRVSLRDGRLVQRLGVDLPWVDGPGAAHGQPAWAIKATATLGSSVRIGSPECGVSIHVTTDGVRIDRTASRYQARDDEAPRLIPVADSTVEVTIVHDASITEIFIGDGDSVATLRSFVEPGMTLTGNFSDVMSSLLSEEGAQYC